MDILQLLASPGYYLYHIYYRLAPLPDSGYFYVLWKGVFHGVCEPLAYGMFDSTGMPIWFIWYVIMSPLYGISKLLLAFFIGSLVRDILVYALVKKFPIKWGISLCGNQQACVFFGRFIPFIWLLAVAISAAKSKSMNKFILLSLLWNLLWPTCIFFAVNSQVTESVLMKSISSLFLLWYLALWLLIYSAFKKPTP